MPSKVVTSFIWSLLEQGSASVIGLVVQIALARLLAPEAFGVLAILLVFIQVATVVAQSGLGMALVQRQNLKDSDVNSAFVLSMLIALALYAVLFAAAPLVAVFYNMPELADYLRVLALVLPVDAFNSVQRSLLQKRMDFRSTFKAGFASVVVSGVVGIVLAYLGFGVWALVAQSLAAALLACIAMFLYVPWRPRLQFDGRAARELFSFGWKICATGILNVIYTGVSELIMGKAASAEALGLYSQGRKWPGAASGVVFNALQNVMFPAFAELQSDMEALRTAIRKALVAGSFVLVPFALFLAAAAEPLVVLLLTEKWIDCVLVFQLTCIAMSANFMQVVNLRAYVALGDSGTHLRLQVIKVVLLCGAIWPTIIITGDINLTALANTLVALFNVFVVDLWSAKRIHGVGRAEQLKSVLPIFILSGTVAAGMWAVTLLQLPAVLTLAAQALVFVPLYGALARLLHVPGYADAAEVLKSLFSRRGTSDM